MNGDLLHGGALDRMRAAFPDAPEPWVDLSTGINPWPYPNVDVTPDTLRRLPTRAAYEACREAMASAIGAPTQSLLLAPGSELLIRLMPDIIRPRTVATLTPSYGDHAAAWRVAGADVRLTNDPLALADRVDAVIVCNPNNPDGLAFAPDDLDRARQTLAARGGWLIVDEAYADLRPELSVVSQGGVHGLIVLRSFGKFYGLAGLRLGALVAPKHICAVMAERLGVWPVSGAALEIGARAYRDIAWREETKRALAVACSKFDTLLLRGGLRPIGGTNLYRYTEAVGAHAIWRRLAHQGIYARRFDWSDRHLRIGLPANAEIDSRLEKALTLSV